MGVEEEALESGKRLRALISDIEKGLIVETKDKEKMKRDLKHLIGNLIEIRDLERKVALREHLASAKNLDELYSLRKQILTIQKELEERKAEFTANFLDLMDSTKEDLAETRKEYNDLVRSLELEKSLWGAGGAAVDKAVFAAKAIIKHIDERIGPIRTV